VSGTDEVTVRNMHRLYTPQTHWAHSI